MNRFFFSPKSLVATTLVTAALGAASVAEARPEVFFSVGLQSSPAWVEPAYVQPQPVYVQPRNVYVQPAPVYVRPPVFVSPRETFERPRWRDDSRFGWEGERAWRRAEWRRHEWREHFGDRDHDRGDRDRHHEHRD